MSIGFLDITTFLAIIALAAASLMLALRQKSRRLPYPPGPPGHLLLRNMRDAKHDRPWERYNELGKQYGNLVHLSITGQNILLLSSVEVVNDLLTKRSKIYSDRPRFPMVKLTGWDIAAAFIPYGDTWRAHRRVFQQGFNPKAILSYRSAHTEKLDDYLNKLLTNPEGFQDHTRRFVASVLMKMTYGHDILDGVEDRIMDATVKAVDNVNLALLPGTWLVNSLPFLQYLPKWFPGCRTFNRLADETRDLVNIMANESYDYAKKYSRNQSCLVTIFEELKASPTSYLNVDEDILRGVCGQAFSAGSETTIMTLYVFFLAMRQNPSVQLKAQEEITRVIGTNRLPNYEDRPLLPYVEAVYREVMRWMPVVPLGIGHRSTADDVYDGYLISEGTLVFANIWAMTNNEEKYPEPHEFRPKRFMNPDGTINNDDTILAFGFGRRVCVGQHFASASVWRTIVALLASFLIEKPKDDDLKDLKDPREIFLAGLTVAAKPFNCSIRPRTAEMAELVRNLDL